MKKDQDRMTRFDWFALLSGIIGLLADIITICSVALLKPSSRMTPAVIWILVPFLILYTTIALSCYARRVAVVRHLATRQKMTEEVFRRIDKGGKMVAKVVGTPLLLLYGISLVVSLWNPVASLASGVLLVVNPLTIMAVWLFFDGLGNVAGDIYSAFDPKYRIAELKKDA
jgi:hypothetical protein